MPSKSNPILKQGSEKQWIKEFLPQTTDIWLGGLTMFLAKKDFVKQNMALKAQFQMLALAYFSQTTN